MQTVNATPLLAVNYVIESLTLLIGFPKASLKPIIMQQYILFSCSLQLQYFAGSSLSEKKWTTFHKQFSPTAIENERC